MTTGSGSARTATGLLPLHAWVDESMIQLGRGGHVPAPRGGVRLRGMRCHIVHTVIDTLARAA